MASDKAHELVEGYIGQRLVVRDFVAEVAPDGAWQCLPERPVQTIGGNLAIAIDIDSAGDGWVRSTDRAVTVRYRAGMAYTEEALPAPIIDALELADVHIATNPADFPEGSDRIKALLNPWRRFVGAS